MNGFSKYGKILSVFLLLPTFFLAIYLAVTANNEIEVEDVLAVSVSDTKYKHRYSGKDDIEEYVSLILDSKDNAPQEIDENSLSYKIEFEMKNGSTKAYEFYPSLRGECLIKDSKGLIRSAEDVSSLLLRVEYEEVFVPRHLPTLSVLTVDGERQVSPAEYLWNFKKTGDNYYHFDETDTVSKLPVYSVSADALKKGATSFSVTPDEIKIAYTVNGASYSKVENLSLKDGDSLEITVSALWKENKNGLFFGEGKWKFNAVYKDSPIITINKTEAVLGDCLVLYAENIDEGETVSLETEISTFKTPKVFKGTDKNFILLPIDVNTKDGEHSLTASYRDSSFQFKVKVTAVSNGFFIKNINAETYNSVTSPAGLKEYESFISTLVDKTSSGFLWESSKLLPAVEGACEVGFASEVLYNGLPPQVYFEGESYAVPVKTSVKSAAKGKVVFAGETAKTGKAIVIDHGCGIMTHYYHLSVVSSMEGEEIEAGKLIALSGKSGFTDKEDLYFAVSINGVFVNPKLFYISE